MGVMVMNKPSMGKIVLIALSIFILSGCCHCRAYDKEEMMPLAASLTHLSTAVEGYVRYKTLPPDIREDELLNFISKDNSQLLEPFGDYKLRVLQPPAESEAPGQEKIA